MEYGDTVKWKYVQSEILQRNIDDLMNKKDPRQAQKLLKILVGRLAQHNGIVVFKKLSERLEAVRDKAEKGLKIQFSLSKNFVR